MKVVRKATTFGRKTRIFKSVAYGVKMTWCVGVRFESAVFLIADSVISLIETLEFPLSTFGERHVPANEDSTGRARQEGPLKLYSVGNARLTFAGSVDAGQRFITRFEQELQYSGSIRDALQSASNPSSVASPSDSASVLVAFFDKTPVLFVCDTASAPVELKPGEAIHLGSAGPEYTELVDKIIAVHQVPTNTATCSHWIAKTLALCQSFGLHHNLMEIGIGGAFVGAWVDECGCHNQPDILYVLHDSDLQDPATVDLVGVMLRDDVLTRFTSLSRPNLTFSNQRSGESEEICRQRLARVSYECQAVFDSAKFDYVSFLNYQDHIATVVEMRKQLRHRLLILEPVPSEMGRIGIYWSPELQDKVVAIPQIDDDAPPRDLCLRWESFKEFEGETPTIGKF